MTHPAAQTPPVVLTIGHSTRDLESFLVKHILSERNAQPHAMTPWARVTRRRVTYPAAWRYQRTGVSFDGRERERKRGYEEVMTALDIHPNSGRFGVRQAESVPTTNPLCIDRNVCAPGTIRLHFWPLTTGH